jgi:hypothetical protein
MVGNKRVIREEYREINLRSVGMRYRFWNRWYADGTFETIETYEVIE